jgi:hypothetical protein
MAMQDQVNATPAPKRVPWNKGKLTGAKPPLRPKHVWSIRTKLQIEGRARDLAMFNLAIDSKLRGCDVVAIRVEDVAAGGYTADRATVRQKKTERPVRFELSEQTRQAVDDYLEATGKRPGEFLFTGHRGPNRSMTTRQYARLVSEWIGSVGLDPRLFGTHSLRASRSDRLRRTPWSWAYAAAKAGVRAMARSMASELSPRGIRVNVVSPGAIRTAIWGPAVATPEAEKAFEKRIALSTPLGRLGEPDQVAKTVLFLASGDASHVQAQELFVDGGATASPSGAPIYRG